MKKMKTITVLTTLAMSLSLSSTILAANDQLRGIEINGQSSKATAQIKENTLLLPLRSVSEESGYLVGWSAKDKQITLSKKDKNVTITLSNNTYSINDHTGYFGDEIATINENTYITSEFISEIMGYKVTNNPDTKVVQLTSIKENPITIRNVKDVSSTTNLDLDIQYPQIEGLSDAKVQEQLNTLFQKFAETAKAQAIVNGKDMADSDETKHMQAQTVLNYAIKYNQNNVLSVAFSHYDYTGGAHGSTIQSSYNFDLTTGHDYKLKDLFDEGKDYLAIINKEIKQQMNDLKQTESLLTPFETIDADQPFYMTDNNQVRVYFQQYEYFPYAMGMPEYGISMDKVLTPANK